MFDMMRDGLMNGHMGSDMGLGVGLVFLVLVLAVVALVKYISFADQWASSVGWLCVQQPDHTKATAWCECLPGLAAAVCSSSC